MFFSSHYTIIIYCKENINENTRIQNQTLLLLYLNCIAAASKVLYNLVMLRSVNDTGVEIRLNIFSLNSSQIFLCTELADFLVLGAVLTAATVKQINIYKMHMSSVVEKCCSRQAAAAGY
jgi:hypothetical protein